jgi:hypothetical protein
MFMKYVLNFFKSVFEVVELVLSGIFYHIAKFILDR